MTILISTLAVGCGTDSSTADKGNEVNYFFSDDGVIHNDAAGKDAVADGVTSFPYHESFDECQSACGDGMCMELDQGFE